MEVINKGGLDISMEKILVVYGESGTGKTTVINEVYDWLMQNGASVKVAKKKMGANSRDFCGVLDYKNKKFHLKYYILI